ncbi:MAG: hypothetical protein CMH83_19055 [Nocardioides sp.]|nr:hypothetical protein [Nocardioides sp.]
MKAHADWVVMWRDSESGPAAMAVAHYAELDSAREGAAVYIDADGWLTTSPVFTREFGVIGPGLFGVGQVVELLVSYDEACLSRPDPANGGTLRLLGGPVWEAVGPVLREATDAHGDVHADLGPPEGIDTRWCPWET